jgi:hypothetical protein
MLFVAVFTPSVLSAVINTLYMLPAMMGAMIVAELANAVELIPNSALTIVALAALVIFQLNLTDAPGATVPSGIDDIRICGIIAVLDETATDSILMVTSLVELVAVNVIK